MYTVDLQVASSGAISEFVRVLRAGAGIGIGNGGGTPPPPDVIEAAGRGLRYSLCDSYA